MCRCVVVGLEVGSMNKDEIIFLKIFQIPGSNGIETSKMCIHNVESHTYFLGLPGNIAGWTSKRVWMRLFYFICLLVYLFVCLFIYLFIL